MSKDEILRGVLEEALRDGLTRLSNEDPDAGFDIARLFMGELPTDNVSVPIAVIETLIIQAAQLGSTHAKSFLEKKWPLMKDSYTRKLLRSGYSE